MVINIIDRGFNFLGQIDNYESLILSRSYHGIGNFELHLHESNVYADKLQKENIVYVDEKKAYIILFRDIDSITGKMIVKGLSLKAYLKRQITFPPEGEPYYQVEGDAETIMKGMVSANLSRKNITQIVVATNQHRGEVTTFQTRYKNLAEELEKFSLATELGWDITLDLTNKRFVFDVIAGKDLTAGQEIYPQAIFSLEYDNIVEQQLIDSKLDYANTAVVGGQGELEWRVIEIIGDTDAGLDSYEVFVDASDIDYDEYLADRGKQELAQYKEVLNFDSKVDPTKNLRYEEDFDLGDVVTLKNGRWNITADRRITGLTEIYESAGFKLEVDFGEGLPTVIDKIKRATDAPIMEGGGGGEQTASEIPISSGNFESTNVEGALDELFTNVSNGKDLIATAITDKGVATSGSDTFQVMANKISNISDGLDISFGGTDIPLLKLEDLKILSIPRNATSTMREVIVKFDGTIAITFTLFIPGTGSPIPLHAEFLVNNILQGDKITVASFTPVETIVEIAVRENDNIKFNVSHDRTSSISARSNLFQLNVYPIFNINPVTHII